MKTDQHKTKQTGFRLTEADLERVRQLQEQNKDDLGQTRTATEIVRFALNRWADASTGSP
jgi:hypothetical protein